MSDPVIFAHARRCRAWQRSDPPELGHRGLAAGASKRVAESADGTSSVMVWSCTAGRFNWHYSVEETLHIISGEVFVTDENGEVRRLGPGDMAFFPAGSRSTWHVPKEVLKLAVCRHSMPRPFGTLLRAWNKAVDVVTGFSTEPIEPVPQPAMRTDGAPANASATTA